MNCFLSPLKASFCGPSMILLARVRSALSADKQRAKTASPIRVTDRCDVSAYDF